jgi:ABC-type lipoprotein export system ATPase subunit
VGLILQSATQSQGGEVFVLDMGEPIRIQDLARQMIELCGFVPDEDIKIEFVGLRPGEKLYEEPIHKGENIEPTAHKKIHRLTNHLHGGSALENLEKIKLFDLYDAQMTRLNDLKKQASDMEAQVTIDRKKYASAMELKSKILEAESIAIGNIVDTINTHARIYLDCFFPDDPISVSLLPFKETKKAVKPQINIQIEYKSMEADLNTLSGGELSRVILAYTLSLGEIFNTPLLLLDESTASLDQEMSGVVFDGLREHFNGKLVLIVAHQVVTGVFDTVVKL